MTYRKKRLLIIQTILFFTALVLFFTFYYEEKTEVDNIEIKPNKTVVSEQEQSNFFEDVEYKGIDANGNRYLLKSELATFNEDNPELIDMRGMHAIFYFRDGNILNIYGDKGKYNNKTNDMEFRENVKVEQDQNLIFANNLDYFNLDKKINIYGNVRGKSLDGNFSSDILKLNIENQLVEILMENKEKQVNLNLKKWKKVLE